LATFVQSNAELEQKFAEGTKELEVGCSYLVELAILMTAFLRQLGFQKETGESEGKVSGD